MVIHVGVVKGLGGGKWQRFKGRVVCQVNWYQFVKCCVIAIGTSHSFWDFFKSISGLKVTMVRNNKYALIVVKLH